MPDATPSDAETGPGPDGIHRLVLRAKGGDREALAELLRAHEPNLRALFSAPHEVDDLLFEVHRNALLSIARFEWSGEGSFIRWLHGIAEQAILDLDRKDERATGGVPLRRLQEALSKLSHDHQEVIDLAHFRQLTIAEIGEATHRSPQAVSMLLLRAWRQLRRLLGSELSSRGPHQEPVLAVDEIQGNVLGGFNKRCLRLVFLRIFEPATCREWLASIVPHIATAEEVIASHSRAQGSPGPAPSGPSRTPPWLNIAFSYEGLRKLLAGTPHEQAALDFTDAAFREGLAARSALLNDPRDAAEGAPASWVVGGPDTAADALLLIADDDATRLEARVAELLERPSGAEQILEDSGALLPDPHQGHEHFGFLDGVSQPGIRGRLSDAGDDFLTPRRNPADADQGKPGQDLLWPGEFVFGYPGQRTSDGEGEDGEDGEAEMATAGEVAAAGPGWARNGSFLVYRRLHQKVPLFHAFLRREADRLSVSPDTLGAMLVGRWRSGAPFLRTPGEDIPELGADDCANNHFEFEEDGEPIPGSAAASPSSCSDDRFPQSRKDPSGDGLPLAAHIRKVYPRDDASRTQRTPEQKRLNEADVQTHRLLRRGIPFGPPCDSTPERPGSPEENATDRGLHFLAYMTSIVDQFELVTRSWVNNPDFKEDGAGEDPIIGQSAKPDRERRFKVCVSGATGNPVTHTLATREEWVVPTGGGYFFAPSISGLNMLSTAGGSPCSPA